MLGQLLYQLRSYFFGFNVFKYITFRSILAVLTALFLCFIIYPRFIKFLRKKDIGQEIRDDGPSTHLNKKGTPTMGGIVILISILGSILLWMTPGNALYLLLWVIISFGFIGFMDDYLKIKRKTSKGLRGKSKLLLQFIFSLPVVLFIYFHPDYNTKILFPFFKNFRPDLEIFYIPFALLLIVGTSNAVNLTDGLDGLAIGSVLTTAGVYGVFSYASGHYFFAHYLDVEAVKGAGELAVFCGALLGGGLGFLWYNTYPAQVFMGDVGSLPLGAALATVALLVKQEIVLAIAGGIFLAEAISVIMQVIYFKISGGKRVFRMAPLHHHFEILGWPEPKVTVRFWIISIILALAALSTLKLR